MSFACAKCESKLKCLETRCHQNHIYRRYRCTSCNLTVRTQEVCTAVEEIPRKHARIKGHTITPPSPKKQAAPAAQKPVQKTASQYKPRRSYFELPDEEDACTTIRNNREFAEFTNRWGGIDADYWDSL